MVAVLSLLVILLVSLLVIRVATVALAQTGLSSELARFQARSAFTGAGFTTSESEKVVHHPVRRRIIMILMLLGNAGLVTAISTLILSFVGTEQATGLTGQVWFRLTLLVAGLAILLAIASSPWVDRRLSALIGRALRRWTQLDVRDYAGLLRLSGDYVVAELEVEPEDWLAGRALRELRLREEGALVLGIVRSDGTYLGAPRGETRLIEGDTLILYGREGLVENLDERRAGARGALEHQRAVEEHLRAEAEEKEADADETGRSPEAQPASGGRSGG